MTGSPSSRSTDDRRRWWLPWLVSVVVHGAVLAWWASLPAPAPAPAPAEPELRPIELVELAPVAPEPSAVRPQPPEQTPTPVPDDPQTEPTPESTPSEPAPPRRPATSPDPAEPPGPAVDDPVQERPGEGAVSLLGLRQRSRATGRSGPVTRPQLPAPIGGHQVVRKIGAVGPEPPPRTHDGQPRSLGEAGFRKRRSGKLVFRDKAGRFNATLLPDGRVQFRDMPVAVGRHPETGAPQLGMPGLAEGLRAASGQELYQKEKRRLLEQTFELRLQMAIGTARARIDRRLRSLYRELLELWSSDSTGASARRVAIFERWDECEEGLPVSMPGFEGVSSSELDQARRDAGQQARETIERFIRRQLPSGSPQAYTSEELRQLNARRRSRARFAPY